MSIAVGDKLPNVQAYIMGENGPQAVDTESLFSGKKVVLFAVPGAFTPGCSLTHLPGYVVQADAIKAKGVDSIICLSVNDPFVMQAWGNAQNAEHLVMLGDADGKFTEAAGLEFDLSGAGLGVRSKRYALIAEDGMVTHMALEPEGKITVSAAEEILAAL